MTTATVITAPTPFLPSMHTAHSVFLAGAIDMGMAVDWQAWVIAQMADVPCVLINPRREKFTPDTLDEQILWELDAMSKADTILMWFPADAKAPVAMLETGLWLASGKLVIGVDPEFYRRRNVELTAQLFGVRIHYDLRMVLVEVLRRIHNQQQQRSERELTCLNT